jgi:hypothetical protein
VVQLFVTCCKTLGLSRPLLCHVEIFLLFLRQSQLIFIGDVLRDLNKKSDSPLFQSQVFESPRGARSPHLENNTDLNSQEAIAIFLVSHSDKVRMIRIRQLGKNSDNNDYFIVSAIEVFGILMEPK